GLFADERRALVGLMVKVESADATAERVRAIGGEARAPFDIMKAGRLSVCHDPTGAEFDVWEPKSMRGTDVGSDLHGAPGCCELRTAEPARAAKFYQELWGWTGVAMRKDQTPRWLTYFTVDDVAAAARQATRRGGKLVSLDDGASLVRSPQGVVFGVKE